MRFVNSLGQDRIGKFRGVGGITLYRPLDDLLVRSVRRGKLFLELSTNGTRAAGLGFKNGQSMYCMSCYMLHVAIAYVP